MFPPPPPSFSDYLVPFPTAFRISVPPPHLQDYFCSSATISKEVMAKEFEALKENNTCTIVPLPPIKKELFVPSIVHVPVFCANTFGIRARPSFPEEEARFTIRTVHYFEDARGFSPTVEKPGFTHIHFGLVRVALTYHGRKGYKPWDIDCERSECEDDYYWSEDDDKGDDDDYSYDRAEWDEEQYQFLVSHKPQDWPALSTPSRNKTSQKEPAPKMMFMLSSASSSHTYDFPD
ncbi:hypothetical protein MTR67_022930 [Solanum verrucosum]|uniref:Uncharacterized protein n=1 Tax=Solanum verrucosum TaxID=315347 RepID=A0AAF0TX69_SOLVR|nr:hypothetical protein MTR67_022930 [Solanum verrucosum]